MDDGKPVVGVDIHAKPEFCVVTANEEIGYGVYTWHMEKWEAEHNAKVVNGRVVPVDYYQGEIIIPAMAQAVAKRHGLG